MAECLRIFGIGILIRLMMYRELDDFEHDSMMLGFKRPHRS